MRLLDRVAQCRDALSYVDPTRGHRVPLAGPADWADAVRACPLRLVLTDPLTALCASLACADGARLHGCLDLVRVPAERLWVEWNDAARNAGLPPDAVAGAAESRPGPAAAYVTAAPDGRSGCVRSFWADGTDGAPRLAAIETWFDLDGASPASRVGGEWFRIEDPEDAALSAIYDRLRFRLEPSWARYYDDGGLDRNERRAVVRESLQGVVRDLPMLFALFLLTNAREALRRERIDRDAVNRRRRTRGEPDLLEHVEVHAVLGGAGSAGNVAPHAGPRRRPRLHHVRGHLVRRRDRVYWRVPHLRGHAAAGVLRSRTVTLSFVP
jgi:hypothetical protein